MRFGSEVLDTPCIVTSVVVVGHSGRLDRLRVDPSPQADQVSALKRARKRLNYPVLAEVTRVWTQRLDRRRRSVRDLDGLAPGEIVAVRTDRIGTLVCGDPLR